MSSLSLMSPIQKVYVRTHIYTGYDTKRLMLF